MLPRLLATFLVTVVSLAAQSSVWKLTRAGRTFYLGGTCHVLRAEDFPLPAEYDLAFEASTRVVFETDLERLQSAEMQRTIADRGVFTDEKSLADVLTPAAWQAVENYAARTGLPLDQLRYLKPWMFVVMITAAELQKLGVSLEGVDLHYFKKAMGAGKKTEALETFEQQLEFMVRLGAGHESELIANTLEELNDLPRQLKEMLVAWKQGDLAALDKLMLDDMRQRYPSVYQELFIDRNEAWLPKLVRLAETSEVEFVLVGAAHLAGKEGLIQQLQRRGFRVEQIKAAARRE